MMPAAEYVVRGKLVYTMKLIADHLAESGKECFTYRTLRAYWSRKKLYLESEWHTIERNVRKLAEAGLLDRIETRLKGRRRFVMFCPNDGFYKVLNTLRGAGR